MIFLTRCGECDESWCTTCEAECPVCLLGAGTDTGVLVCSHCEVPFCRECVWSWECPDCSAIVCATCWHAGLDCGCHEKRDEDEEPDHAISETNLPPGFSIWQGEPRKFVDKKAWRPLWERRKKTPPWKEK